MSQNAHPSGSHSIGAPQRRGRGFEEPTHDAYRSDHKLANGTVCPQCHASIRDGRCANLFPELFHCYGVAVCGCVARSRQRIGRGQFHRAAALGVHHAELQVDSIRIQRRLEMRSRLIVFVESRIERAQSPVDGGPFDG